MPRPKPTILTELELADAAKRLERLSCPEAVTGCWLWVGGISPAGYGNRLDFKSGSFYPHRVSWVVHRGPLDARDIDHKCRNRACVNPDHLEPVSHAENVRRGVSVCAQRAARETCPEGHPLLIDGKRVRRCWPCTRKRQAKWARDQRARAVSK